MGRKPQERTSLHARVHSATPGKIKEIALMLGFVYNFEGSTGLLLDAIAQGDYIVVPSKTKKSG